MGFHKEQFEDGGWMDGIGASTVTIAASQAISLKRIADALEKIVVPRQSGPDPMEAFHRHLTERAAPTTNMAPPAQLRKSNAASPKR